VPDVALAATILRHLVGRLPGSSGKLNSIDVLTNFLSRVTYSLAYDPRTAQSSSPRQTGN